MKHRLLNMAASILLLPVTPGAAQSLTNKTNPQEENFTGKCAGGHIVEGHWIIHNKSSFLPVVIADAQKVKDVLSVTIDMRNFTASIFQRNKHLVEGKAADVVNRRIGNAENHCFDEIHPGEGPVPLPRTNTSFNWLSPAPKKAVPK